MRTFKRVVEKPVLNEDALKQLEKTGGGGKKKKSKKIIKKYWKYE